MPELSQQHKRDLGDVLLELDEILFAGQRTPAAYSADVRALLASIGAGEAVAIECRDDHLGLYGWPADGVRARIAADGGEVCFGWRLTEWPGVLLTAEHHAVWRDPEGTLIDIVPLATVSTVTLFAPDERAPVAPLLARVLHVSPDRSRHVAERVASLKGGQRVYEERRAAKAGQTLDEWIAVKHFTDPLIAAIPAFVAACAAFIARRARLPDLIELCPDDYSEAIEGAWNPAWETEYARDRLVEWCGDREGRLMDIEAGMHSLGLTDTRVFTAIPEEN